MARCPTATPPSSAGSMAAMYRIPMQQSRVVLQTRYPIPPRRCKQPKLTGETLVPSVAEALRGTVRAPRMKGRIARENFLYALVADVPRARPGDITQSRTDMIVRTSAKTTRTSAAPQVHSRRQCLP